MNNNHKSLVSRLKEGYEKAKKPICFFIMFIIMAAEVTPDIFIPAQEKEHVQNFMLFLIGLIIMQILFEIYEKIFKDRKKLNIINSNDLLKNIEKLVKGQKEVKIQYIGIAGRHGWNSVLAKLLYDQDDATIIGKGNVNVEIALLDPNSELMATEEFGKFQLHYSTEIKYRINKIKEEETNTDISMYYYKHMPNFIGFLINDNYLFVTICHWEGSHKKQMEFRAGGSNYFVYDKNDVFGGSESIDRFSGWFNYIKKYNEKVSTDKEPKAETNK